MRPSSKVIGGVLRPLMRLLPVMCLLTWTPQVDAYVLQGPHLLELMIRNLGRATSLSVAQRVLIPDPESEGSYLEIQERLTYLFDDRLRSEFFSPQNHKTFIIHGGAEVTVINDEIVDDSHSLLERYVELLLYRSRPVLTRQLSIRGIDAEQSSLTRWEGRPVFVVGTRDPRQPVSQIWLEKDSFRPLRWISRHGSGEQSDDFIECRFTDWRATGGVLYPGRMVFFYNDQKVREITVEQIALNPPVSPDTFDIEKIRAIYPQRPRAAGNTRDVDSQWADEVKETIDEFRKMYED